MNDVEHDLRELLERKASSLGSLPPRLPDPVRKRGRRRQAGTVFVSGIAAVAVVLASMATLRAVDPGPDRTTVPVEDPSAGYEVFERTATVGNFTITSPSDWYLVRLGRVFSVLQLTNFDHGLAGSVCGNEIPDDGAALYVARRTGPDARVVDSVSYPPLFDPAAEETEGPCGPGRYVTFSKEGVGAFIAWAAFGDDTDPDDRKLVFNSFADMSFDSRMLARPSPPAAYVVAGGENAAGPWRLELGPSSGEQNSNVQLHLIGGEGPGIDAGPFTVPDVPIEQAGGDPTFGAVTKEASGVELRLEEGTPPIPATIVPLPPSLPFDFDLFFASNDADVQATAVALDDDGVPMLPSTPVSKEPSHTTFLDDVDHLRPNEFWAPAVKREGEHVVMPVTFPDGATAEVVYPAELALEKLNVYPDSYANLEGSSGTCGWPVHAARFDPRDNWARGDAPLDRYERKDGRIVELWRGQSWARPHNILITRIGPWNVLVLCRSMAMTPETELWAEHLSAHETKDGLLILEDSPPLDAHPGDTGATIRFSGQDVVVDLEISPDDCRSGGATDLGAGDGVVEWCAEGDVHVYANAFEARQNEFLERLTSGLEIRDYRRAS